MKKLIGMKSGFSSLENKKLANTKSIIGGGATNEKLLLRLGLTVSQVIQVTLSSALMESK